MAFPSPALPECPPLLDLPKSNTSHVTPDIILSSGDKFLGTVIEITCPEGYHVIGQDVITCLKSQEWDIEILPHCTDVLYGIPDSLKLYIAVFSFCAALSLLVFTVIFSKMLCFRDRKGFSDSEMLGRSTESVSSMAYFPEENKRNQDPEPLAIATIPEEDINMQTFVNTGYYDQQEQEQWRQRLSSYDSEFDTDFDQWQPYPDNDRKWSNNSIQAVEQYNYDRYGRIPRATPTVMEIEEDNRTPF